MFPTGTNADTSVHKVAGWLLAPTRRKWVTVALTAALIAVAIMVVRHYRNEAVEARVDATIAEQGVETLDRARRADETATADLEVSRRAIRTDEVNNGVATDRALQAHPEWANQPVPDDVLGSLRD